MERGYFFRLAAIVALFIGSLYVLLPTILQEDPQSRFADSAASVETTGPEAVPEFVVRIAHEGEAEPAVERLRERLEALEIHVDRISVDEEGGIEVLLAVGSTPQDVADALTSGSDLAMYPFAEVVAATGLADDGPSSTNGPELPEDAPEVIPVTLEASGVTWAQVQKLSGVEVPEGLAALDVQATAIDPSNWREVALEIDGAPPEGLVAVAVDGAFRGVAWSSESGTTMRAFDEIASREAVRNVWLAGGLAIAQGEEGDEGPTFAGPTEQAESKVPPWLRGLLPDTRMDLGLDLQGGIDLTLQVELDEAVLSQVSRDLTYLKDSAAREGLTILRADDDKADPIIKIRTDDSLADLQKWFAKSMADYEYYESPESNLHVFRMKEERQEQVAESAVDQVLETLRKRVDATGVKEPSIVRKGGGRINVQLPGMVDLQAAIDAIGTTAVLEFRMVDEQFDQAEVDRMVTAAEDTLPSEQFNHYPSLNEWLWRTNRLPEDRLVMWEVDDTTQERFYYALIDEVILTGNDVNNAGVAFDRNNLPFVSLEFKPRGARVFCTVTTEHEKERFAIILDGVIKSAPVIRERICGGRASIEMGTSLDALQEAETLALVLRTGSLNAPVSVGEVRTVGSTLGKDAIAAGETATIIGSILVFTFMALWYRRSGWLANIALALNVMMVLSVLSLFGATLTLPGIAGIALTIGMAVDANIIIFERIREELALGQHARKAVETGFEKGLSAVVDANVTTAIAGVVLFSYGTGPIRGFAVTLLIGIGTTLVTALFVTRTFMELSTRSSRARLRI